jgi:hypothetical protein
MQGCLGTGPSFALLDQGPTPSCRCRPCPFVTYPASSNPPAHPARAVTSQLNQLRDAAAKAAASSTRTANYGHVVIEELGRDDDEADAALEVGARPGAQMGADGVKGIGEPRRAPTAGAPRPRSGS